MVGTTEIKPDYAVPSMAQVQDIPWNGLDVVSTFSGCGGTCLGYRMAGYRVLWSNEYIPLAQNVYQLNHPDAILDRRDIREITGSDILQSINRSVGDVDVLEGSPPCSAFSLAGLAYRRGKMPDEYGDKLNDTGFMFWEFIRIVNDIKPRVFVAENVSGLVRGVSKGQFKWIYQELRECGYRIEARVLDASWLGVPQARQRLFIQGVRNDLDIDPSFPRPLPYQYTVADVMPYICQIKLGSGDVGLHPRAKWSDPRRPFATICQSDYQTHSSAALSSGGWVRDGGGTRRLTIDELKIISSFPDDFKLTGTWRQQWERLGRAVPPLLAKAIADHIRDNVFGRLDE